MIFFFLLVIIGDGACGKTCFLYRFVIKALKFTIYKSHIFKVKMKSIFHLLSLGEAFKKKSINKEIFQLERKKFESGGRGSEPKFPNFFLNF